MQRQEPIKQVPVTIYKHYSYDHKHNCLGFYVHFSCYVKNHYMHKTFKKRKIDDSFDDKQFVYQSSLTWCEYICRYIDLLNKELEKELH